MKKIGLVTGANRGIGFATARALAKTWGDQGLVYLTARSEEQGRAACRRLENEGLTVAYHQLDLADENSIHALAEHFARVHGGLDVLIQNGAFAATPDTPAKDEARIMIRTNNWGTYRILTAFRPMIRPGARVLVVASGLGLLSNLAPQLRDRFNSRTHSMQDILKATDAYVEAVENGLASQEGWPEWVNIPSKVGQVALTRVFAREFAKDPNRPQDVLINAACPGWTNTDAARPYLARMPEIRAKEPDEAAVDVLWLATLPAGTEAPYGELVQYRKVLPFGD